MVGLTVCFAICIAPVVYAAGIRVHIINGTDAKPHAYPFMLSITDYGMHKCGASLLTTPCMNGSSDIVLTAAHCIKQVRMHAKKIKAGKHARAGLETGEQERNITWYKRHEFNKQKTDHKNDIAVIKLNRPIKFTETIQPIDISKAADELAPDSSCKIIGWGYADVSGEGEFPQVLQELQVNPTSSFCAKHKYHYYDEVMLCVERKTSNPSEGAATGCYMDSGGPMICKKRDRWIQYGIISSPGDTSGRCDGPIILTRVSGYTKWIEEQIKEFGCG